MAQLISVKLSRFDGSPWGFRLQGGKDFGTPLVVQKVNGGSPAEAAGLRAGDAVIKVNNTETFNLRHKDAQDVIVKAGNNFEMTVQRGGSTWKPSVTSVTPTLPTPQPVVPASNVAPVTKTSLAAKKQDGPLIGSGHNFSPKPFLNGNGGDGSIKSIVNKQYNSPVGIYSEETIAETLSAQAEVLAGGVLGVNFKKNEKNYNAQNSEVFKMVQEADKEPKTPETAEPTAQSVVTPPSPAVTGLRPVSAPETKQQPTTTPQTSLPPGQNVCADCERLIVGVFVRIKDKNLHVECFKCSTCGTSLKNVGYYNINNKLYCDIHAKLVARQSAPAGLVPFAVPPGGKAPAGTISAALANVGASAPLSPLSPSLSNHSSPQPFSTCSSNGPHSAPPQRPSHLANGSSGTNGAECNGMCNSKTFTTTLTIQTGNEIGSTDGNRLASDNNNTNNKSNRDLVPIPKIGEVCEIVFNPVIADDKPEVCSTEPPTIRIHSLRKQPTRLGSSPVSPPSLRPVQAPTTNNICGPKPFGSSSVTPSSLASPSIFNSGNSILPRPQSQTVTETAYFAESDRREVVRTSSSSNPASVRSKSLIWPPPKPIEDITYPTASPIYINPNPALSERHRQSICREQEAQEARDVVEVVVCEETARDTREETIMDKVSCPGPVYRRVEFYGAEARNESRRETVPRAGSTEGVRRSLTPTRITQPVPQPWTATVTTGSSLYEQAYPVVQDLQICREVYQQRVCQQYEPEAPTCQRYEAEASQEPIREEEEEEETVVAEVTADTGDEGNVDLQDIVPPSVAICPKGVDGQHEFFTEVTEKDVGDLHIKKTTVYEKTVELLSPDRASSPNVTEAEERSDDKGTRQIASSDGQRRSSTVDREVEDISGRRHLSESAEVVAAAVDAQQLVERIKKEEEEERLTEETVTASCQQKRVCFEEERNVEREEERVVRVPEEQTIAEDRYRELTEEIRIQKSFEQRDLEEQRRQSLREQVEVHQSLREQQAPEKRKQTLQERRLSSRLGQQQCLQTNKSEAQTICGGKKHVQFMTQGEPGGQTLQPVKNSTPKEWHSEMVKALTTATDRAYSPLDAAMALDHETATKKEYYSHEVTRQRYEEVPQVLSLSEDRYAESYFTTSNESLSEPYCSRVEETARVVSPFQEALTTAPDRPYTPLGHFEDLAEPSTYEWHHGCQDGRSQTPVFENQSEGYCPPAKILYTSCQSQEVIRRERSLSRRSSTPQPLPTPPPNYRLRDSSRSRPETPSNRSLMTGLKKPDTIPAYQRNLVAMKKAPVGGQTYVPSRSPTPTPRRSKSPAQGPPEPPECFVKAQAPKIREDTPPKCRKQPVVNRYAEACEKEFHRYVPPSDQEQSFSYHVEEDTPSSHIVQDYVGRKTVYFAENGESLFDGGQKGSLEDTVDQLQDTEEQCERTQKQTAIENKKSGDSDGSVCPRVEHVQSDADSECCLISKFSQSKQSLSCPISCHNKFPKTGVRVLPPCPKVLGTDRPQNCQNAGGSSTVNRESQVCRRTISQSQTSAFRETSQKPCPETGVTVLPCRAYSDSGTKAGVVVVPCEGSSATCPRAGICITPTPDRTGLCVSPGFGLESSGPCNRRSGSCSIDVGTSPETGVCVTPCKDGSGALCIAPCNVPGRLKPTPKSQCSAASRASLPFPQIPLPYEEASPQCPVQRPYQSSDDLGFQPIHEPRTNLGSQLTRLTLKQNKHIVQVYKPQAQCSPQAPYQSCPTFAPISKTQSLADPPNLSSHPDLGSGVGGPSAGSKSASFAGSSTPKRGRGILNQAGGPGSRVPLCGHCNSYVRGPFITALGQIWCPEHFTCVNGQCRRPLQDIGFVEEKGQLYCEYCFEQFIAPSCNKCNKKVKGDCLNAIGKHFHPECFNCSYCGKLFGNNPFFLEEGLPYCEADWNELFTTKCFACGFPVEAGDRWVEALNNNYHSQCFNCTMCKKNLEGQSFYAKGGRPFCKNHAR